MIGHSESGRESMYCTWSTSATKRLELERQIYKSLTYCMRHLDAETKKKLGGDFINF